MSGVRAKLERFDAPAERGELIDGLRALIAARSDAGGESIVGLVEELCASGPLAVVFDDVQWSDEASLEVIHRLSSLTPSLPLLVIGAIAGG